MKIGEVARKAGIRTSAIRFYEKAGVLPPAPRQNGQRHFATDAALQLTVARKKYGEMDLLVSRLKNMQKLLKRSMRCHCTKLDDCGRILLPQR